MARLRLNGWQRLWVVGSVVAGFVATVSSYLWITGERDLENRNYTENAAYYAREIEDASKPLKPKPVDKIAEMLGLEIPDSDSKRPVAEVKREALQSERKHQERIEELRQDRPFIIITAFCIWFFSCTGIYGAVLGLYKLTRWISRGGFSIGPTSKS